jgi:hypothetical protein
VDHGGMAKTKSKQREMRETRTTLQAEMAAPRKALSVRLKESAQNAAKAGRARSGTERVNA